VKTITEPVEEKLDVIIAAAQRRFGIYGAEKTSMREIADDLHMSKASLYYYFPDKESLYKSVIEKEQTEFLGTLQHDIENIDDPARCLKRYAINRLSYFRKLVNLGRVSPVSISDLKPKIAETFLQFRSKEMKIVTGIIEKGRKSGQFTIKESSEAAALLLEILRGMRSIAISNKKLMGINDQEFEELSERISSAADIFIRGLMYKKHHKQR
jgi:TetR/AcrR family transcriptional regulator